MTYHANKNSLWSFNGKTFETHATDINYGYTMNISSSNSRHGKILYPKKMQQHTVSISFIFESRDAYIGFADFLNDYFVAATSAEGGYIPLEFTCEAVGIHYDLMPSSVNCSINTDTFAPTRTMQFTLIRNRDIDGVIEYYGNRPNVDSYYSDITADTIYGVRERYEQDSVFRG